jgi:hypothetical protein
VLIAPGHTPNTDGLGLELAGIEVTSHGYVEICMHELGGEGSSQIGATEAKPEVEKTAQSEKE